MRAASSSLDIAPLRMMAASAAAFALSFAACTAVLLAAASA